ncbi:methyltransferase C-terminal domain-containing protein [Dactylosporangium darangshiense]|uniref:methyltransferase C-terminal domain-containing protein n=1 Tax=Dactylosporangium darangshiense TaxID=579108 RepID=UPI003634154B
MHAKHTEFAGEPSLAVKTLLETEAAAGLHTFEGHLGFADEVFTIKRDLLTFLMQARAEGKRVVGYGAPGKGNTLLNHCGIREDLLEYTVDRSPHKQGMFLPGTHIPIHAPERIAADRPDYVLVLPWNLRTEISAQLSYVKDWGGKLVYPIPVLEVEG